MCLVLVWIVSYKVTSQMYCVHFKSPYDFRNILLLRHKL